MPPHLAHRFVAEIRLDSRQLLTTPALEVDWTPAVEWAHFQQVRRGRASLASAPPPAAVRPRWDPQSGPPYVAALEVSACQRALEPLAPIPLEFLTEPVRRAVTSLVEAGRIAEGAAYTWRLCAFDTATADPAAPPDDPFTLQEAPQADDALQTRRRPDLLRRTVHHGPARGDGGRGDFPLVVSRSVLAQAAATAGAAGELEAGGILLGRVSRDADADAGELMLEVTAQVPASEALAESASLRFTPRTWQAVAAAIGLRRSNERIVGWWHSHPRTVWPCRDCPAERRQLCPANRAVFSSLDLAFHRTAFQGPINVALLLSFLEAAEPRNDLFGWWQGSISERDFHVREQD